MGGGEQSPRLAAGEGGRSMSRGTAVRNKAPSPRPGAAVAGKASPAPKCFGILTPSALTLTPRAGSRARLTLGSPSNWPEAQLARLSREPRAAHLPGEPAGRGDKRGHPPSFSRRPCLRYRPVRPWSTSSSPDWHTQVVGVGEAHPGPLTHGRQEGMRCGQAGGTENLGRGGGGKVGDGA